MRQRARTAALVVLAAWVAGAGGDCGGGSGSGGSATVEIESPDPRCGALGTQFPPGFDFVPGIDGRVVVANVTPPTLVPFDVEGVPPTIPSPGLVTEIPADSDSDGLPDFLPLFLDGIFATDSTFAIATNSGYEELLFFRPDDGSLRNVRVEVPASFAATDNPFLPAPGTSALRTGLSTFACVRPPPGALDSRGDAIATSVPVAGFCDPGQPSYLATFTSGVAEAAGHLFVSTSNLGDDQGTENTQYLPGSVLVYDIDRSVDPLLVGPDAVTPVILTTGFNATHVTPWSAGGRDFVLVTQSGAIGVELDDPSSPAIEGGGIALTDAAIDVIDAQTLELVGTVPLGRGGLSFDELAIDPGGRVAVTGSAVDRVLLAIALDPLLGLPSTAATPVALPGAALFDAGAPFRIPPLPGGAPLASCPGFTVGVAFNDAGDQVYATDFCDGTLSVVRFDAPGAGDPVEPDDFVFRELLPVVRPLRADTLGRVRAPGSIRVRPGRPGIDYTGPDVLMLVGEPEGLLCGIRVESP